MKKHAIGLALFSSIFAAFAFAFAYLYAPPLPPIAEVGRADNHSPVFTVEGRSSCRMKYRGMSSEVLSSQIFLDEGKIISKVRLNWNGSGAPPREVGLTMNFFALDSNLNKISSKEVLNDPFAGGTSKIVTVFSRAFGDEITERENLYAVSIASDESSKSSADKAPEHASEKQAVLIAHGERSIIKK